MRLVGWACMRDGAGTVRTSNDEFARRLGEARGGCPRALGELLQSCRRFLLMIANRELDSTLRPKQGPSDLVQEALLLATSDFHAFRGTTQTELSAWLHSILQRRLQTHTRAFRIAEKRAVNREIPLGAANEPLAHGIRDQRESPADVAESADESARLHAAMRRLAEKDQVVLRLRTWQQMRFEEIGEQLDLSSAAAEKLWFRALRRLQIEMRRPP